MATIISIYSISKQALIFTPWYPCVNRLASRDYYVVMCIFSVKLPGTKWSGWQENYFVEKAPKATLLSKAHKPYEKLFIYTGELGYDGPLYDGFLHMTDNMLGHSPMHIKYLSYVYDGFCIWRTNFPGPIESVISKFTCTHFFISNYLAHFGKVLDNQHHSTGR